MRYLVEGRTCCSSLWMVRRSVVRSSGLLPIRALPFLLQPPAPASMTRFVEPCVNAHYGVLLSPAAILLTAGTWSGIPAAKLLKKCGRRPISSLDRVAGRSNLLKFCGPLQVLGNVLDSMRTCFLLEAHFCISRGETPGKRLHDSARRPSNFVPAGQGLRGRKISFGTSKT